MNRPIPTEDDIPQFLAGPYGYFHKERIRAHEKHEASGKSMEQKDWDDPGCLRIALEELGEIARAFNDYELMSLSAAELHAQVLKELIQLGAMISAWTDAAAYYAPRTS